MSTFAIDNVRRVKVVIVGDYAVGKTSVALRFTQNQYKEFYQATVAASFWAKTIESNGTKIMFQIWDTAGTERYRSLIPMYIRGAEFAIVMYDITSKKSFENVSFWSDHLVATTKHDIRYALIGNKTDIEEKREVSTEVAKAFAEKQNMYFSEVSARTGENVERFFSDIAKIILTEKRKPSFNGSNGSAVSLSSQPPVHRCC